MAAHLNSETFDGEALAEIARRVRLDVLEMTSRMGGHPTSCFSAVEILTVLYHGGILRVEAAGSPIGRIGIDSS